MLRPELPDDPTQTPLSGRATAAGDPTDAAPVPSGPGAAGAQPAAGQGPTSAPRFPETAQVSSALTEGEAEALRTWLVDRDLALGLSPSTAPDGLLDLWALVRTIVSGRTARAETAERQIAAVRELARRPDDVREWRNQGRTGKASVVDVTRLQAALDEGARPRGQS